MTWRLVPGALAGWIIAWLVLLNASALAVPTVALAAVLPAMGGAALVRWSRGWAASLIIVAAIVGSTAVHLSALTTGPVADHIGRRAVADVSIVGDVRVRQGSPWDPQPHLEARAHLTRLRIGDEQWQVGAPILLRLPSMQAPPLGAVLRVGGTLREGDPLRGYAAEIAPSGWDVVSDPGPLPAMANAVRSSLHDALARGDPRATALVAGLAVGDETGQPPELAEQMRISGLSHLTAVSGGNTALVVGVVLALSALLGAGLFVRAGLALMALGLFVVVVGPQPSVLRAAVMGVVALIALVSGGQRQALAALAFSVTVLLVLAPGLATSWGFALSVWATAGLVLLTVPLVARLPVTSARLVAVAQALALTVAAQIATAPLIASFGDGLSLVAVPANLVVVPAVGPVTVLGLVAALVGLVSSDAGEWVAMVAEPFAAWIAWVAQVSAGMPLATLPWPGGWFGAGLAVLAAVPVIWWIRRRRGRHELTHPRRVALVLAVVAGVIAIVGLRLPDRAGWPPPGWIAVACDVGQGDALVIRGESDQVVVVDAGPDPEVVDRCLSDLGISRIGLLVLTHPHIDHVGGVPGVLAGRSVDRAVVSPLREPIEQVRRVDGWLAEIPTTPAVVGEVRDVDGITVTTLWPQRIIRGPESAPNNASVVVLVEVRGIRMLLFGDVETSAQVALRASFTVQGVDVVKVPHHGSRLQDPALGAWTGARLAIISVGADNGYGHPAPETLRQWWDTGAVVARTDEAGDIAIVADPSLGVVTR